ncbi:MAG: hypothetical protein A3H72_03435 [Candidatus Doudnabacteria bacterium RIFCSPLOWO2_02_FULL_48_8]|uniref:Cytidyltransferase-like domain-containing protein n=1 Tax=Candidatus Doudnabacteria bacterium RIFCSPHIGHO2_01_FULL_46_24 TaxID=1817825 RepID=A0A1F5NU40_9BACT|nr:MAG: hypothetical protein A2720_01290 [Candidatus Doudnabacteria bacterium RIFCSPHIGHO2_01_FULL_46_24]OGE95519.1 MAG: hypothetical protein A3H72_03435 [Candidatus Doudnabacteria bacterium RIFCSPLOWO2_02_FULL_48_8]OGE96068.1 MAG: hypothetical protein A3E98_02370 [Candidatus Doudnabacteria bacterium RIFCSPHIGHO2_12_FULL_48_11]
MTEQKKTVVAVSGGFDPIHAGHVRYFHDAKKLGDELVVILNNDNWLYKKKGYIFMNERERKEIIKSIKYVDHVVITNHPPDPQDMSVIKELRELKPDIFANGGDRVKSNVPEVEVCRKLDIKMIFNVGHGGKIQSSSELVRQAADKAPRKVAVKLKGKT